MVKLKVADMGVEQAACKVGLSTAEALKALLRGKLDFNLTVWGTPKPRKKGKFAVSRFFNPLKTRI